MLVTSTRRGMPEAAEELRGRAVPAVGRGAEAHELRPSRHPLRDDHAGAGLAAELAQLTAATPETAACSPRLGDRIGDVRARGAALAVTAGEAPRLPRR